MLQQYGLNPTDAFLIVLLAFTTWGMAAVLSWHAGRLVLLGLCVGSVAWSTYLLPITLANAGAGILLCHLAWVGGSAAWARRQWALIRAYRAEQRAEYLEYWAARRAEVQAVHPGLVYEVRPDGPDDTGVPVYRVTTLGSD